MALIEVYHVVASNFLIDPADTTDIPQGRFVSLDHDGYVILFDGTTANGTQYNPTAVCVGIAGDSRSQGTTSYTPESGSALAASTGDPLEGALIIGAWGNTRRYTQNRIADNYNEVLASGKMTVYGSGGEFWTDQYVTTDGNETCDFDAGVRLFCTTTGRVTTVTTAKTVSVATCLSDLMQYPSGVPGVLDWSGGDVGSTSTGFMHLPEGGNSMGWGEFVKLKLTV